jgi:iron complex outermembrane receptor protein
LFRAAIAFAQETAPEPTPMAEVERVIVTGSHIPTAEESGPNPVQRIDRELIEKSGERTTEELLRNLTVANANGLPVSSHVFVGAATIPGPTSISLRGFDTSATLVLIDGRRVAPYGMGAGNNGTQSFVDLNSIPRAAIDSIEILKDGASTTYGADAVAGVVNIKFRHDYHGAEATVEYGNTLDKDSGESSASALFGVGNDKTQVTGVLNYYRRNSIFARDRAFFAKGQSGNSSPYNLELSREAVVAAIRADTTITPAQQMAIIAGLPNDDLLFGHAPFGTNGTAPASQFVFTPLFSFDSRFDFSKFLSAFPETERYGGFFNAEHKICGDQLILYADTFYQNTKVHDELAPVATSFTLPGSVTVFIPPSHPADAINPATGQPFGVLGRFTPADVGAPPGAFNPFNPFQQFISGFTFARVADFGNRIYDTETDAFMSTVGAKGDKLFDGSWGYDVGFRYSQIKNTSTGSFVSATRFNRILNANDPIFDPTSSQFIGTTVPFNPFTDYRVPFPSNFATIDFATIHPKNVDTSKLATLDATMYTTALFKLPAGGVGLAYGGQFRRESIEQNIDQLNEGDNLGETPFHSTRAGRRSYGIYAEADIPVFSAANSVPAFHALEFTAAARFEYYLNNDTNILIPKFGMRWQPFDDSLTIRSTWGEGFREPSLYELFGSSFSEFEGPGMDVPVTINTNPALDPEDSRNFTAGIVYTPKFIPRLTVSVDIFDIERKGVVFLPSFDQVLARERAGALLPGEVVVRAPNDRDRILFMSKTFINGGEQRSRGVDFGLQYQLQTSFGTFTSLTQATYLDSFRFAASENEPVLEVSNSGTGLSDDAYLKWKGISRLDWAWKGFDIVATVRYTSGFHEILEIGNTFPDGRNEHWVDATWVFDAQATYELTFTKPVESQTVAGYSNDSKGGNIEPTQTANYSMPYWKNLLNHTWVTIGCNNVFGQDPPQALNAAFGYPSAIYDATGRFVYVSLKKKF